MLLGAGYLLLVDTLARTIARDRDAARHPDRLHRRAVLPLAAGARPARAGHEARGRRTWPSAIRGKPVGRDVDLARAARARCSACSAPTAAGKTTLFKTLLGLLPRPGRRGAARRRAARRAGRAPTIARRIAYVPQAHVGAFPLPRARHGADGPDRASRPVRPPGPRAIGRGRAEALPMLGIAAARRGRLHAHQRRPAPARADRPRARPGSAAVCHGRADRQPRLRQPGCWCSRRCSGSPRAASA